jgi:hypothetical protein
MIEQIFEVAAIEASKSGQDLRMFCPQCEKEFNGERL